MAERIITTEGSPRAQGGRLLGRALISNGALIALIILYVLLLLFSEPFRKPFSQTLVLLEVSFIGIVAAGQTFAILTGGIDLSVEAMMAFTGIVSAILISGTAQSGGQLGGGIPSYAAIPLGVLVGTVIGLIQGIIIVVFNITPFIVSLGFLSILTGASLVVTKGSPINIRLDGFFDSLMGFVDAGDLRIPVPFILTALIYLVIWIVLRHTKLGRYIYAIGGNETAAQLSGINVNLTKITVYAISGMLASIGGMLVLGRLQSGAYQNGTDYTLTSVAAVVIGGTALVGGTGGIWGTLIGALIMRLVQAGLVYMDVPPNAHKVVIGVIIVVAVALDVARRGEVKWLNQLFRRRSE
jgi:ribose/xylose/arabinose/galactoside ABC-type transport system permease subunit